MGYRFIVGWFRILKRTCGVRGILAIGLLALAIVSLLRAFSIENVQMVSITAHDQPDSPDQATRALASELSTDLEVQEHGQGTTATMITMDLASFLEKIGDLSGIKLVLLDPAMFSSDFILTNETLTSKTQPYRLFSFGLFEQDQKNFVKFCQQLPSGYRLIEARGIDYRRVLPKKSKSVYKEIVTHYFIVDHSSIVLHFPLILPRHDYFWIASLQESILAPQYRYLANLEYAIPIPMGIESFGCENYPLTLTDQPDHQSIDVCKPNDTDFYLWQLPRARFYECHFNDIVYPFRSKFPKMGQLNDTGFQAEALGEIMRISKLTRSPTIILCGTLLGWYRQCDYIVESKDVDVGLAAEDYNYEFFKQLFESRILNFVLRLGTFDLGLEFKAYSRRGIVWLDVFFLYRNHNSSSAYMWANRNWYETVVPVPKGICSAELFGVLAFIPCNYEEFVETDYGHDGWFAPYTGRWYANKNMKWKHKYEESEEPFMEYRYKKGGCERPDEMWGCDEMPPEVVNSTLYQKWVAEHGKKKTDKKN